MLLVEAVWRLLPYQLPWHARRKLITRLQAGTALKKKVVVALARPSICGGGAPAAPP